MQKAKSHQHQPQPLPGPSPWPNANARLLGFGLGLPVQPLDRLAQFSPLDFERFTLEWASDYLAKTQGVDEVQQRGGSGDKGRDIVVWFDPPSAKPRRWSLYQCKHYDSRLGTGTAAAEIGKVLHYTHIGDYTPPLEYWFVTHLGVTSDFQDMLDDPEKLRAYILANWNERCATKIVKGTISLTPELKKHISRFDFSIFRAKQPLELINEHTKTKYHLTVFGAPLIERPPPPTPPSAVAAGETEYVNQLFEIIGEALNASVSRAADFAHHRDYTRLFDRSRLFVLTGKSYLVHCLDYILGADEMRKRIAEEQLAGRTKGLHFNPELKRLGGDLFLSDPITFEEALSSTEGVSRSLLVGNGFSYKYFSYKNLLDNAGLETNEPLRSLFDAFDTVDFEAIIKALEDAALIETKYNKPSRVLKLRREAGKLRKALVHAVRAVHPDFHFDIAGLNFALQFISHFSSLFTLNYDFLLHWVRLQDPERFWDGFGLGGNDGGFRGPFTPEAWCNVYNVHGGLHLFADSDGSVRKRIGEPAIIEAIGKTITEEGRLPLYVAEGTSSQKLSRIFGSPYLRHCFDKMSKCDGAFFVFGHSADRGDEHIYDQIFKSAVDHLYFFVHEPTQAKLALLNAELERYKAIAESEIEFTFIDSASASVWG